MLLSIRPSSDILLEVRGDDGNAGGGGGDLTVPERKNQNHGVGLPRRNVVGRGKREVSRWGNDVGGAAVPAAAKVFAVLLPMQ